MPETTTITLPVSADILSVIAILLGLLVASALISLALPRGPKTGAQMEQSFIYRWFRIMDLGPIERVIVGFALLAMAVLFLMALAATLTIVIATILGGLDPSAARGFGTGALLVALLGSPFLIWRSMVAQSTLDETRLQTKLQDEALFNDKINAAAKDLAARHQVSKTIGRGKLQRVLTEWQDDLVTRAAAIDRLEGLALEAFDRNDIPSAQRIARMLSIYVKELSRQYPPEEPPENTDNDRVWDWAKALEPARSDMERAVQSLGNINPVDSRLRKAFRPEQISLEGCNLQGFKLDEANLQGFSCSGLVADGTSLNGSNFKGTNLIRASLQGCSLFQADLTGALVGRANLKHAFAHEAKMESANLFRVDIRMARFGKANLIGADLRALKFNENDDLKQMDLRGAAAGYLSSEAIEVLLPHWSQIFYVAEKLPDGHPSHWIEARLTHKGFTTAWRKWATKHHPDITIAPDYRHDA